MLGHCAGAKRVACELLWGIIKSKADFSNREFAHVFYFSLSFIKVSAYIDLFHIVAKHCFAFDPVSQTPTGLKLKQGSTSLSRMH